MQTSKGYEIEVFTDGRLYDENKVFLHIKDVKLRKQWHARFNEMLKIAYALDKDIGDNLCCLRSLKWIGFFHETFKEQQDWLESGMKFYSGAKKHC